MYIGCRLWVLVSLLLIVSRVNVLAATSAEEAGRSNRLTDRMMQYAFPQEHQSARSDRPLGRAGSASDPVGTWIGDTWWDMQHYGSMGRMVDWGYDTGGGDGFMIHFNWMRLATSVDANRHYAYNVYYADGESAGTFMEQTSIQAPGEYAGFVGIDVTNDGRAVLGGHNNQGGGTAGQFYWDFGPGFGFFGMNRRIPDTMWYIDHNIDTVFETNWPKFRYQEVPGHDPVLHVLALWNKVSMGE